jgi:hypothetical protein
VPCCNDRGSAIVRFDHGFGDLDDHPRFFQRERRRHTDQWPRGAIRSGLFLGPQVGRGEGEQEAGSYDGRDINMNDAQLHRACPFLSRLIHIETDIPSC